MLLDRDNEKKNRGKATKLLPDDICGKLKDLNLKGSEPSEGKLNVKHNTFSEGKLKDNFSNMKDSKKNNFGDDINKIGDQLRNFRITEKEYNYPPKNPEIVLNILSDNTVEDNKNHKIDCNINVDEEEPCSEERKIQKANVLKEEVYTKLKSDSSSLVQKVYEEEKKSDEKGYDSKKTEENVEILSRGDEILSRGPVSQKRCHQLRQPYDTCSRGHHSGGIVRVTEQPSQTTVNGYQTGPVNSQLNIIPNGHWHYPPSMETSYLHVAGAQTANINTTSYDVDEEAISVEKILQEHPYIYEYCEVLSSNTNNFSALPEEDILSSSTCKDFLAMTEGDINLSSNTCNNFLAMTERDINQNKVEEIILPSSPEDSGIGSPAGSYQPPSVGHDSVLDSPSHGAEYPHETLYDNDPRFASDNQKGQVTQERSEMLPITNDGPDAQGRQVMQQGSFPQGTFPLARNFLRENQNEQFLQKIPDIQGQQIIQNQNVQGQQIIQKQNIQGQQIIQKQNIQGQQIIQKQNIQGQQIIQKQNIQGQQIIQKQNITEQQIIPEKNMCCPLPIVPEKTQVGQIIQEGNQCRQIKETRIDMKGGQNVQDSPYPPGRDIAPQICRFVESPTKSQGTKYIPILPKPPSAKTSFQRILDQEQRLLSWLKINEKLIENPKQLEIQDAEGDTDLMIACCNTFPNHLEMIYAMVEKLRQKPNSLTIRNKQGHSALYLACVALNDVPEVAAYIAEALIEQKIDVANMTYDGGLTLIHILEKKGDSHKKVLEGLLALKDSSGRNVFLSGGDVNANNFRDFNDSILLLG